MTALKKMILFAELRKLKLVEENLQDQNRLEDLQEVAQKILVSPLEQPAQISILMHLYMKCQNQPQYFSK